MITGSAACVVSEYLQKGERNRWLYATFVFSDVGKNIYLPRFFRNLLTILISIVLWNSGSFRVAYVK